MKIRKLLGKTYANFRGWRTNEKLVVIESDDWGSIRMRDSNGVNKLFSENIPLHESKFTQFDGLERTKDLEDLFEVLSSVKDIKGRYGCFTPLVLTANPDFHAIRSDNFENYKYEDISKTFSKYGEYGLIKLWKNSGINENLFYPQFHGREHLNYVRWMNSIRQQDSLARKAFDKESLLGIRSERASQSDNYMAAFEAVNDIEQEAVNRACQVGLDSFKDLFGFSSISAIPSQSIVSEESKIVLLQNGVKYLQCGQHFNPSEAGLTKRDYFWGHKDRFGMVYWRRNVNFEPYHNTNKNHVDDVLSEIALAFNFGKPAVISSHRINFTSRITTSIKDESLKQLKELLKKIVAKWPDVQFVNSEELAMRLEKSFD